MKTVLLFLLMLALGTPIQAQKLLCYTIWADGALNAQLPKSNLYGVGTGLRAEISKPLRQSANALFVQAGYTHFFEKAAFRANIGLVNVGYRYQSHRAFNASVGVGVQYWQERMRVRFPDATMEETFRNVLPGTTVGLGVALKAHYRIGLENRVLFKPEDGTVSIRNTIALSLGYTL